MSGRTSKLILTVVMVTALLPAGGMPAWARGGEKTGQVVDAGSFGIFVAGKRVATEVFDIQQRPDFSVATSELKLEDGKISQKSELQITSSGNLLRYEWQELSPGKSHAVVEPNNEFLVEHLIPNSTGKAIEQPFLLPTSTLVLEDYFFIHREILVWRYLAQTCSGGLKDCKPTRLQFGVLVPRQRMPMSVSLQYAGPEKVMIRGTEQQLSRINLQSDAGDWVLWLDGNLKLIRILIAAENTEIVRD